MLPGSFERRIDGDQAKVFFSAELSFVDYDILSKLVIRLS